MTKRTKKVGITRKYGVRYGASLRKIIKKFEIQQHAKYFCPFCGKNGMRRVSVGIWHCKPCFKTIAGGAWTLTTPAAVTAKTTMLRLKKMREEAGAAAEKVEETQAQTQTQAQGGKKGGDNKAAQAEQPKGAQGGKQGGDQGGKGGKGGKGKKQAQIVSNQMCESV
eukprot:TRINITY_DN8_c0_g1_i1.p2 TRINITY_DN8_c0_g1~~TRINITY_DN8_c0_g1_i1.p2  ORF type:complete len:166 (-),score=70.27 TRINITY_DN8_c0_g1_i1:312-809(-)